MFRNLFFVLNLINIIIIKSLYSDPIAKGPLVFSDEFNYVGSPDPDKWYAQIDSPTAVISGVSSCATDKNAYVTGGNLTLVVKKENLNGKNYTSGALNSWRGFRYGIFEMRAKLGTGRGTWSNFLLYADQRRSSKWPLDGEIDIAEVIFTNSSKVPSPRPTSGFSVHCDKYSNSAINIQKLKNNTLRTEVSNFGPIDEFNVYTLDWSPERLVFYVNEIEYYRYNNDGTFAGWPFDGSMNVMFNLKLGRAGDTFAGYNGIDDSIFPVYHDIDYIRVYALPGEF
jgi:beta-glucanase (GH16 family)